MHPREAMHRSKGLGLGFRVENLGFRVQGLGCSGFRG